MHIACQFAKIRLPQADIRRRKVCHISAITKSQKPYYEQNYDQIDGAKQAFSA